MLTFLSTAVRLIGCIGDERKEHDDAADVFVLKVLHSSECRWMAMRTSETTACIARTSDGHIALADRGAELLAASGPSDLSRVSPAFRIGAES